MVNDSASDPQPTQFALLVDPRGGLERLTCGLPGLAIERVHLSGLQERLARGSHMALLIAADLGVGGPRGGPELVRELINQGLQLPVVLVLERADRAMEDAALLAGATSCVDGSRVDAADLARVIRFAHASRRLAEEHKARVLADVGGYLAHEGRNALAGIRGAVQVVSDHLPPGSPDRVLCQEIRERVARFVATLDALTLILRPLETPRQDRAVALSALIREEAGRLPGGVQARVEGEELDVHGDREQLRLLFGALLQNAAEAVEGSGEVAVRLARRDGSCVIDVTDSGPALDPQRLNRMLDLFATSKGVRAGLGLPVAKRVAEAHGGRLELSCTSESSLRVTVRLPLAG